MRKSGPLSNQYSDDPAIVRRSDSGAIPAARFGFPPQAFVVGAQKAGTTSLAFLLDSHPALAVSDPKETDFFSQNWVKGLDWYRTCFPDRIDSVFIDATPAYSMAPLEGASAEDDNRFAHRNDVPKRIHAVAPDAKFIYILRNPVGRTYSAYWHRVRAGNETRSFRVAIAEDGYYLSASDYEWQIRHYLEYFPLDRFLFVLFEDFVNDPQAAARKCCAFLGVDELTLEVAGGSQRNPTYTYSLLGRLVTLVVPSKAALEGLTHAVRAILPEAAVSLIRRATTKRVPKISDEDRLWLQDYFSARITRLEKLTGLSVDAWR